MRNFIFEGVRSQHPVMVKCYELVSRAAACDAPVLVTGETGTGKELFARAIHQNSFRQKHDFCVVDCTAIPETLAESILFGHRRGSFTGASETHIGLVKMAHRGTLFLDELGELPLLTQKTMLRVTQEKRFRPIGATREEESDFRLVAATNRNLQRLVERGAFRPDLFFRLQTITVTVPPLRERRTDIPELASFYLKRSCRNNRLPEKRLGPDYLQALAKYSWPGNVRELVNVVEHSVIEAFHADCLTAAHLPEAVLRNKVVESDNAPLPVFPSWKTFLDEARAIATRQYVQKLADSFKTAEEARQVSGLSQAQFYRLITGAGYRGWRELYGSMTEKGKSR